jgi:hypothetical protein
MYCSVRLGGGRSNHDGVIHRASVGERFTTCAIVERFCPIAQ